ncbi:RagB/SusD family nutrient uptake outer membrane protein [Spirosoma fluminis]
MNKKLSFVALFLCLGQFSCKEDFLVTTDPTRISTGVFYKNETQFRQALNGVYGQLQSITNSAYIFKELPSDNTTVDLNPADRGDAVRWEAFEFSTVNAGNTEIGGLWNQYYSALYNSNYTLEKLATSDLEPTKRTPIEGQLKFLRAYFYFDLVQYFGDVVLLTSTVANPNQAFDLVRSPQAEVWAQIEKDLKEAAAGLPATYPAALTGSATKGAALALLGKVYLTQKKYAEAVSTLKQVTGYSLNPVYADNFNPARKNGPESIFEVQYQGGNDLGEWSSFAYTFAPRASAAAVTGFANTPPGGRNIPTNDLIAAYEPGDVRKDASLKTSYTLNGKVVDIPYIINYVEYKRAK